MTSRNAGVLAAAIFAVGTLVSVQCDATVRCQGLLGRDSRGVRRRVRPGVPDVQAARRSELPPDDLHVRRDRNGVRLAIGRVPRLTEVPRSAAVRSSSVGPGGA